MHHTPPLLLTLLLLFGLPVVASAQAIDACDWEAGHPSDPDRVGPGVGSGNVDTARAIAACRDAVEREPDTARFHYQLGRALVYEADRAGTDWTVGMPSLERAAALEHRQAMFVLGLMHKRGGDVCASEPLTRGAAERGLKSARITYVNDYLSGVLDACPPRASLEEMQGFLGEAREQVSGYYENMLLDALDRHLSVAVAAGEGS
jgi:hypothetical protein